MLDHTPIYIGPPAYPLTPPAGPRCSLFRARSVGFKPGCATDGASVFTNGIDALGLGTQE